jgi:mannose-6-phosphate isomerase
MHYKKAHHLKTEMWYVMQADPDARIIVGFKKDSTAAEYIQHLDKTLLSLLMI